MISSIKNLNPANINKCLGRQQTIVEQSIKNGDNPFFGVGSNPSQVSYATVKPEVAHKVDVTAKVRDTRSNKSDHVDTHFEIAKAVIYTTHTHAAAIPVQDETETKRETDQEVMFWPSCVKSEDCEIKGKAERELSIAMLIQGADNPVRTDRSIIREILFNAKTCQYDLIETVESLETRVAKDDIIHQNKQIPIVTRTGNSSDNMFLQLRSDSDLASTLKASKTKSETLPKISDPCQATHIAAQSKLPAISNEGYE